MKIGILTYHRSINYGAYLQAYALAKSVQASLEKCNVEIIDYTSSISEKSYLREIFRIQRPKNIIAKYKQYKIMEEALNKMPMSSRKICSDDLEEVFKYLHGYYDVIIVGSDEIWKVDGMRGFPNPYWLNDNLDCIKVSYAASSRNNLCKLTQNQKDYIKESISKFSYIGVRDEATRILLEGIFDNVEININCDPTFMLDMPLDKQSIEMKIKYKYKLDYNKPIIGVMGCDKELTKKIKNIYGDKYNIVSLYVTNKYCDSFWADLDPFEWIVAIGMFKLFITSFFHGTIFSIKNETPFISIEYRKEKAENSKMADLLTKLNLDDRFFMNSDIEESNDTILNKIDELLKGEDIDKIRLILSKEQSKYSDFISNLKKIID